MAMQARIGFRKTPSFLQKLNVAGFWVLLGFRGFLLLERAVLDAAHINQESRQHRVPT